MRPTVITRETSDSKNPKILKSLAHFASENIRALSVYLAPHRTSGVGNTCNHASDGCRDACIADSRQQGHGRIFPGVFEARKRRTELYFADRKAFLELYLNELVSECLQAKRTGETVYIRDNMGSDIDWTRLCELYEVDLFGEFCTHPHADLLRKVSHYNYSKDLKRTLRTRPANDHITFSRSETNNAACLKVLDAGHNVAVVFSGGPEFYGSKKQYLTELPPEIRLPDSSQLWKVIDGDAHDFRHRDPAGPCIVGLRMKGDALQVKAALNSGFAIRV